MKYIVQIQVTPEAGHKNESRAGGPGAIVGRLVERFKPEAFYTSPARRELFLVCDLEPVDMTELMIAASHIAGQHATFTPVVDGSEFRSIVGKALPAAKALVDG